MMTRRFLSAAAPMILALGLASCAPGGSPAGTPQQPDGTGSLSDLPPASPEPVRETANVSYDGVVRPAGISIYQEGTHRLSLANSHFILIESAVIDLNGYVDENVRIFGSLRPTVEAGGMIMRVERIELLGGSSESSSSSSSLVSSLPSSSPSSLPSSSAPSSVPTSPSSLSSALPASSAAPASSGSDAAAPSQPSAAFLTRIELMARQDFADANWTQQYCTSHIGFCLPVHRNWWFKSFGTTSTALWQVELSSEPVLDLHDGPIAVRLLPGSRSTSDKTVVTEGTAVTGYRDWTDNRHFEITADARLEGAVRYITEHLSVEE